MEVRAVQVLALVRLSAISCELALGTVPAYQHEDEQSCWEASAVDGTTTAPNSGRCMLQVSDAFIASRKAQQAAFSHPPSSSSIAPLMFQQVEQSRHQARERRKADLDNAHEVDSKQLGTQSRLDKSNVTGQQTTAGVLQSPEAADPKSSEPAAIMKVAVVEELPLPQLQSGASGDQAKSSASSVVSLALPQIMSLEGMKIFASEVSHGHIFAAVLLLSFVIVRLAVFVRLKVQSWAVFPAMAKIADASSVNSSRIEASSKTAIPIRGVDWLRDVPGNELPRASGRRISGSREASDNVPGAMNSIPLGMNNGGAGSDKSFEEIPRVFQVPVLDGTQLECGSCRFCDLLDVSGQIIMQVAVKWKIQRMDWRRQLGRWLVDRLPKTWIGTSCMSIKHHPIVSLYALPPLPQVPAVAAATSPERAARENGGNNAMPVAKGPAYIHCRGGVDETGFRHLYVYDPAEQLVATYTRDELRPNRYIVNADALGIRLAFEGTFTEHAVIVTDEYGAEIAVSEPVRSGKPHISHYQLVLDASVDWVTVLLVLIGSLSIQLEELQLSTNFHKL